MKRPRLAAAIALAVLVVLSTAASAALVGEPAGAASVLRSSNAPSASQPIVMPHSGSMSAPIRSGGSGSGVPPNHRSSGRIGPHPFLVPVDAPASYNGHYYAGVVYSGDSVNATEIQTTLFVPEDQPQAADFYYVLLSIWDNAGSYDQLGFANNYGAWGLAYSTTTYCGGVYYYSSNATELAGGENYTFRMTLSGGFVDFDVRNASGSTVWIYESYTGGTVFEVDPYYTCESGSYYDYTDYEEVYSTTAPVPPYDFFFADDSGSPIGSVTDWTTWTVDSPSSVVVYINGGSSSSGCPTSCPIVIANEPYYLYFPLDAGSLRVEPTDPPTSAEWNVSVAELAPDAPISLAIYSEPAGWSTNLTVTDGAPPFSSTISVAFPNGTLPGSYDVGVVGSDGSGTYARISLDVVVLPRLTLSLSVAPRSAGVDAGQPISLSAIAAGGSGIYGYVWTSLPPGCPPSVDPFLRCAPSVPGNFSIGVTVIDSLEYARHVALNYTVDSDPTLGAPQPSSASIDLGQTVTFTAHVLGGAGGDRYTWSELPAGCESANTSALNCTPGANGSFPVTVDVTDANGFNATSAPLSFPVDPDPEVDAPTASPSALDAGMNLTLTVAYSSGAGGDLFSWTGLPSACESGSGPSVQCIDVPEGSFEVSVGISDANGFSTQGPMAVITVFADPWIAGSGPSPLTLAAGGDLVVNGTASGGVPPYVYSWTGLPGGCVSIDGPLLTCSPDTTGRYDVQVTATDQAGLRASKTFEVSVAAAAASSSSAPEPLLLVGIGIAAAVAVGVGLVVARKRRRLG